MNTSRRSDDIKNSPKISLTLELTVVETIETLLQLQRNTIHLN